MSLLELIDMCKTFETPAVRDVCLTLAGGKILSLLGPSGCGKTTLLRLVAGLEPPDQGRVFLDGRDITHLQPHKRNIGMMFQEYALFPHKSVYENVAFGLHMQRKSPSQIREQTEEMLSLVGLSEFSLRNVADLSGGERQRVALARSLAPRPRLLMLDEPLGSLDRALRERLLTEIRHILKGLCMTAIFVTHDQTEALTVGDEVAVMNRGNLVQLDTPEALYLHPKSVFVAEFLGYKNLLKGRVAENGGIETVCGTFHPAKAQATPGEAVTVVIPADGMRLSEDDAPVDRQWHIQGKVASRLFTGQNYRITVAVDQEFSLFCELPARQAPPNPGARVSVWFDPQKIIVIT